MEHDLDAWCWGTGDYAREEVGGFEESIRYLLRIISNEGPFVGIVGFSTRATTALTLVSLAERGGSPNIMESFKLSPDVSQLYSTVRLVQDIVEPDPTCSFCPHDLNLQSFIAA